MRGRIARVVAVTSASIVLIFVMPLCLLLTTLARDRVLAAADQEARTTAILLSSMDDGDERRALIADTDARSSASTVVLYADGTSQGGDAAAYAHDPEVARARAGFAFTVVDGRGGRILVPVVVQNGTAVVVTSATPEQLAAGVLPAVVTIGGLGLALIGVAILFAREAGRRLAAPLIAVADTAHALRAGDLSARAKQAGPDETVELARALNGLADRIGELLVSERAAVGDLAHRLRTPITALRLELDGVEPPDLAARLSVHLLRVQEAADRVVREARRPVAGELALGCDAAEVVATRTGFWAVLADDQGRRLRVTLPPGPVPVAMPEHDLRAVVDILIDNVFAHTPEGVHFSVELASDDAGCRLVIADSGPGFPAETEASRVGSTGLGLDIVERTVEARGGILQRPAPGKGATVVVVLPREV